MSRNRMRMMARVSALAASLLILAMAGLGQDTAGAADDTLALIRTWNADLATRYEQNRQSVDRLTADIDAIKGGHTFLDKDENGKPYISGEDQVRCDWKMKQRQLCLNLNKAMRLLAGLYRDGGARESLAPRFEEARKLILEIQDFNDREYIKKATRSWNDLVDLYNELDKAVKAGG